MELVKRHWTVNRNQQMQHKSVKLIDQEHIKHNTPNITPEILTCEHAFQLHQDIYKYKVAAGDATHISCCMIIIKFEHAFEVHIDMSANAN